MRKSLIKWLVILTIMIFVKNVSGQTARPSDTPVSDEINKQLPKWLSFSGEYRLRVEGRTGLNGRRNNDDLYTLSRLRLELTIKPTDNLKFFIQSQDSRIFGFNSVPIPRIHADSFDIRQAYVEWQQKNKTGLLIKVGRQEFHYGVGRLVGHRNWTNVARAFDAVKIGYSQKNYQVEAFASSEVINRDNQINRRRDGANFYGIFLKIPKLTPKTELNSYVFWRTQRPFVRSETGVLGNVNVLTFGTTLLGSINPKLDYELDLMLQRGSFSTDEIRAYAIHSKLNYKFSQKENTPNIFAEYNYASGDSSPNDGLRGTFDQLFPAAHANYGMLDLVGLRNIHNLWIGSAWQSTKKLRFQLDYHSFWLAKRRDGLYSAGGALTARIATGAKSNHVAQEINLRTNYSLRPGLALEVGYGRWLPGGFWKEATMGAKLSFSYMMLTYKF